MAIHYAYGLRFFGFLMKCILLLMTPYFWLKSLIPHKRIPAITNEILLMSATKLADNIRNGKIKSENVIRAYIRRIQEVNPIINAVVDENFKAALEEAHAIDQRIAKKEKRPEQLAKEKPLLGVPITIKECISVKGLSYTGCTWARKDFVGDSDGEVVRLLRDAGAIIIAVTNTPELCLSWETNNKIYGRTVNPYNTNRVAGGSSGGEGALMGAGASVAGMGSDLGGSIRIPAHFNGVFGHKPTAHIVPIKGHYPCTTDQGFLDLVVIGPLTRYAEDLKLIMKILTSNHDRLLKWNEKVDVSKLDIYYKDSPGCSFSGICVEPEIKAILHSAVNHLKKIGANVKPADFVNMQYNPELCCTPLAGMKDTPELMRDIEPMKSFMDGISKVLMSFCGLSKHTIDTRTFQLAINGNFLLSSANFKEYLNEAENMRQLLKETLGTNGVLLYPTFPIPAFQHNQAALKMFSIFYTMIVNVLGFPATHVPLGLNKAGLPIGIQVIAASHQDRLCLAVAEELERKFGGWRPPTEVTL